MVALKNSCTLTKADAKFSAKKHGLVFVQGPEVMKRWETKG
jgi:hypothetical protein